MKVNVRPKNIVFPWYLQTTSVGCKLGFPGDLSLFYLYGPGSGPDFQVIYTPPHN